MHARVTSPATRLTSRSPLAGLRVLARLAGRREAAQNEERLARALAGDFGRGVQADVLAAQREAAARGRTAA